MSDPPTTAEALADVLTRLQAAVHHYQYCDSADSGDANDAVDDLNRELGELLCPESGPIDLAAALATPDPAVAVAVDGEITPEEIGELVKRLDNAEARYDNVRGQDELYEGEKYMADVARETAREDLEREAGRIAALALRLSISLKEPTQ